MPIDILSVDDSFNPCLQAIRKHNWMQTVFNDFAETIVEVFSKKDAARLGIESTSSFDPVASTVTINFCGRSIRFSFMPRPGEKDNHALMMVHLLPKFEDFEEMHKLEEFGIDGDGITSLSVKGENCSLRRREDVLAIGMHYMLKAVSIGFCPK